MIVDTFYRRGRGIGAETTEQKQKQKKCCYMQIIRLFVYEMVSGSLEIVMLNPDKRVDAWETNERRKKPEATTTQKFAGVRWRRPIELVRDM